VLFCENTNSFEKNTNMALNDAKLRALKAGDRPYKHSDGEGLFVLVTTGGSKLWTLAYRFVGKQKTLALGKYPTVSLLDARRARDAAKLLLSSGISLGQNSDLITLGHHGEAALRPARK
jgi:hypothetical protein